MSRQTRAETQLALVRWLVEVGERTQARRIVAGLLADDARQAAAWVWAGRLANTAVRRERYLRRAMALGAEADLLTEFPAVGDPAVAYLRLAESEQVPLLERVRYVARCAVLLDTAVQKPDADFDYLHAQRQKLNDAWHQIQDAFTAVDTVRLLHMNDLDDPARSELRHFYQSQVFPILTPMAVDPGRPFPFISSHTLSLAIWLTADHGPRQSWLTPAFVRLKIPPHLPRWLNVHTADPAQLAFVPLEQVLAAHVPSLFPGMRVLGVSPFRVTRRQTSHGREQPIVRLEMAAEAPEPLVSWLMDALALPPERLVRVAGELDLAAVETLARLPLPQFHFRPWSGGRAG